MVASSGHISLSTAHGSVSGSIPLAALTTRSTSEVGERKSTFAHTPASGRPPSPPAAPSRWESRCVSQRSMPRAGTAMISVASDYPAGRSARLPARPPAHHCAGHDAGALPSTPPTPVGTLCRSEPTIRPGSDGRPDVNSANEDGVTDRAFTGRIGRIGDHLAAMAWISRRTGRAEKEASGARAQ